MADMQKGDSAGVLVARFLRGNNYEETLRAFLAEAGLPPDAGSASPSALTIEKILEEKSIFDLSRNFEKTRVDDIDEGWSANAPTTAREVLDCGISANVLSVSVESLALPSEGASLANIDSRLFVTAADRRIHCLTGLDSPRPSPLQFVPANSPTLCYAVLNGRHLFTGTMAGTLSIYSLDNASLISERKDHQKYMVRLQLLVDDSGAWLATAGWDECIFIYRLSNLEQPTLDAPRAVIKLQSNPQAICFASHPDLEEPLIVASRRDSTFLYYYGLPSRKTLAQNEAQPAERLDLLGRQNLAPHSNAWVAFTPSSFAPSPRDPLTLAIATSHTPHMKLIIVKLLLPKVSSRFDGDLELSTQANLTQASQARADLARQDREDAAILIQCTTLAPQSNYSTPELAWRPDGSGVWVNGDDGAIRGIEASTGKVVAALKGAHDPGTKIRCLWAGNVSIAGKIDESLVSGGFDQRLVVWGQARCYAILDAIVATMVHDLQSPLGPLPMWMAQRSRSCGAMRQYLKLTVLVGICLMLGYTISTLHVDNISSLPHAQNAAESLNRPAGSQLGKGSAGGQADHPVDLAQHSPAQSSEKQSIYNKVATTLGGLGTWTKTSLNKLVGGADANSTYITPGLEGASTDEGELVWGDTSPLHGDRPIIGKVSIVFGDNKIYNRALRTHTAHNRLHNYQMFTLRQAILDDVWTKPAYILSIILRELAKPETERLQWLLWVDADTIILNPNVPSELFLPPETGEWDHIHLLATYDFNGLNNGVFPIRVHPWSVELLSAIVSFRQYRPNDDLPFRDQSAMAYLLQEPRFKGHMMQAPQRWFNAYQGELNETLQPYQYRRGDFLVHFAGDGSRNEHMLTWLQRAEAHDAAWEIDLQQTTYPQEVREFWQQASVQRAERVKLLEASRTRLVSAIERVEATLLEHEAKLDDDLVNNIRERVKEAREVADHPINEETELQTFDQATTQLEQAAAPVLEHAAGQLQTLLKEAHATLFEGEHLLLGMEAEVGTANLTEQLETHVAKLKEQLQLDPVQTRTLRVAMQQLAVCVHQTEAALEPEVDDAATEELDGTLTLSTAIPLVTSIIQAATSSSSSLPTSATAETEAPA